MIPRNEHDRIDSAILAVVQPAWRKVAMIVVRSAEVIGRDDEAGFNLIASRIEALVQQDRLEAQGDLKKWRYSEVRLLGSAL